MRPIRAGIAALLVLGLWLPGCRPLGTLVYFLGPRRMQKAEYKLTREKLAVLIETARPDQDSPVFTRAMHEKLVEVFREHKVNTEVVPLEEVLRLRQENADFARWSLPRVGRALGAAQVLYVRIERLQLREGADSPVLAPTVQCRVKVLGVDEFAEKPRLWPAETERDGREIPCERHAQEAADIEAIDSEAAKLGKDTAQLIAMPFYDVDLDERIPPEK
jgi:hypothetical protein